MQLIQPNVVGNFLQSYSAAQDQKRQQEETQYNRQRQMRADERDEKRFSFDLDEAQFRQALQRKDLIARSAFALDTEEKWNASVPQLMQQLGIEGPPPSFADRGRIIAEAQTVGEQLEQQAKERQFKLSERVANANIAQSYAAAGASNRANRGGVASGGAASSSGTPLVRTKPLSSTEINKLLETRRQILDQSEVMKQLQQLKDLSKNAAGGPIGAVVEPLLAPYESVVQKNAPEVLEFLNRSPTRGSDTVVFQNTAQRLALNMLRTTFGGNPTEGERDILMQIQGSASMDPESRARVFDEAIAAAKRRQQLFQQQEQAITTGNYAAPSLDQSTTAQTAPVAAPLPTAQRPAPVPAPRQIPRVPPPPGFKVLD